jgi:hypothetical protein
LRTHVPTYPGFWRKPRAHGLGLDDGQRLGLYQDEQWTELPSATYPEWKASALAHKLDVRVDSIIGWRYFPDAIADPDAEVSAASSKADANPRAVSINWRVGNQWCKLFAATAWEDGATTEAVETHAAALTHLGVGVESSPSGLGQATMRAHLSKSHTTANLAATADLYAGLVGGRAEISSPGAWDRAWEIDRRMAYVAEAANPLPVGAATYLFNAPVESCNRYPQWFGRCAVIVKRPLKIGPFPLRLANGDITFPRRPGQYVVWLWRGEVEDCIESGCVVIVQRAWGWSRLEPVLAAWAEWMFAKRRDAPTEPVAGYVKRAAVSAIGWHAMPARSLTVKRACDLPEGARSIVNAAGFPTAYAVEVVEDDYARQMIHWASFIWSEARRTLYRREMELRAAGVRVLGSNFDSIVIASPTGQPSSAELGEWREQCLTHYAITASRSAICDQYVKLPGVSDERRAEMIEETRLIFQKRDYERQQLWAHPTLESVRERQRQEERGGSQIVLEHESFPAPWRPGDRRWGWSGDGNGNG